jgi:hypothetical protein
MRLTSTGERTLPTMDTVQSDCKRALARNQRNLNSESSLSDLNHLVCGVEKVDALKPDVVDTVHLAK